MTVIAGISLQHSVRPWQYPWSFGKEFNDALNIYCMWLQTVPDKWMSSCVQELVLVFKKKRKKKKSNESAFRPPKNSDYLMLSFLVLFLYCRQYWKGLIPPDGKLHLCNDLIGLWNRRPTTLMCLNSWENSLKFPASVSSSHSLKS